MNDQSRVDPMPEAEARPATGIHTLALTEVTSFLLFSTQQHRVVTGGPEDLRRFHRQVLRHNLLVGWWGVPIGFIWNVMALIQNRKAFRAVQEPGGTVPPGWHPDPTGRHAVRYWDGTRWTDQVSDVSTDPV